MKAKTKQLRFLWVVVLLLPLAFFYNCKKGPDSPSQEKDPAPPSRKKDPDSLRRFKCYQKTTQGKARILDLLKGAEARVFTESKSGYKNVPQYHYALLYGPYHFELNVPDTLTGPIIALLPQKVYRCGGDPYEKVVPEEVLLSGLFYAVEFKSGHLLYYDEGEGSPAFTKVK